ncbi:MAG: IS1595 family transposase, partial [Bacteroidota bacterium]
LRQMTCWSFKRKVQQAMSSSGLYKLIGDIEVDEFAVGGLDAGEQGRSKGDKKLVALIVERKSDDKIGRVYAHKIEDY